MWLLTTVLLVNQNTMDAIIRRRHVLHTNPFPADPQFAEHYTLQEVLAKKHPGLFCGSFLPTEEWTSAISGLSILDLACGDGIYSRMMKRGGASEVCAPTSLAAYLEHDAKGVSLCPVHTQR